MSDNRLQQINSAAKDTWKEIQSIMKEYRLIKDSGDIHAILDVREAMIGYMYTAGYLESEYKEMADLSEVDVEDKKAEIFLYYRGKGDEQPNQKYTEKEAEYKARQFAKGLKIDYANFNKQYKRFRNAREVLLKTSESISQRVSLLKMEDNTNQFKK